MKTVMSTLYRAICHFSIAYSGIILYFSSLMTKTGYIDYDKLTVFLRFSIIFGISSLIFSVPNIPKILKKVLHFIINTIAFMTTFVAVEWATQAQAFVMTAFFAIIYVVISLIALLCRKLAERG